MTDDQAPDEKPDVISGIESETLNTEDMTEIQNHESVERAIHTDGDMNNITGFVVDLGDKCYAVRFEDDAWRVVETTDEFGDALAVFD